MKSLALNGTPSERGAAYGEQARAEISECLEVYRGWFSDFARLDWDEVRRRAQPFGEWLGQNDPDLSEEMRMIAAGAGLEAVDVVALNFRTEIAYSGAGPKPPHTECTSFGIPGTASLSGHTFIAENWDWLAETLPLLVTLDIDLGDGRRMATVTEAGMVAKFGMNSDGIGLCVNLLGSDVNHVGASFHTLARRVLESRTALEAVWAVSGSARAGSGNFLIGSGRGELVDVEYNPLGYATHFPKEGFVGHANHFVQPQPGLRDRLQFLPNISPGSYFRQFRIESLLRGVVEAGPVSEEAMQSLLADHYGEPESICRHGGPAGTQRVLGRTNVSVVMDLTDRVMHLATGYPCETDFARVELSW
jgi:isopenicillin-N N-acyltransferase-like protein